MINLPNGEYKGKRYCNELKLFTPKGEFKFKVKGNAIKRSENLSPLELFRVRDGKVYRTRNRKGKNKS